MPALPPFKPLVRSRRKNVAVRFMRLRAERGMNVRTPLLEARAQIDDPRGSIARGDGSNGYNAVAMKSRRLVNFCQPAAGFKISEGLSFLEHSQHDRADKGESQIRGHHAELMDVRTKGHWKSPRVASR